jgi:hypothetical protein
LLIASIMPGRCSEERSKFGKIGHVVDPPLGIHAIHTGHEAEVLLACEIRLETALEFERLRDVAFADDTSAAEPDGPRKEPQQHGLARAISPEQPPRCEPVSAPATPHRKSTP